MAETDRDSKAGSAATKSIVEKNEESNLEVADEIIPIEDAPILKEATPAVKAGPPAKGARTAE